MLTEKPSMKSSPLPGWGEAGRGADDWHAIDPVIQFASPYVGMGNSPVVGVDPDGKDWEFHGHQHHQQGYVNGEKVGDPIPGEIHGYWYWNDSPTFSPSNNFIIHTGGLGHAGGGNNGGSKNSNINYSGGAGDWADSEPIPTIEERINDAQKALAYAFRNSPFLPIFGFRINPFFKAEAIMIDLGSTLSGTETDGGYLFILGGPDAGKISQFGEIAPGIGSDGGFSIEATRIDFSGDVDDFRCSMLEGLRTKIYVNGGVEFYSAGLGVSWSIPIGLSGVITGVSYQVSIGLSIFGPFGTGINKGEVYLPKETEP